MPPVAASPFRYPLPFCSVDPIRPWLNEAPALPRGAGYHHRQFGTGSAVPEVVEHLQAYAREAHRDALLELESMVLPHLEPFPGAAGWEPAPPTGYPYQLHEITLQGYFGELLAAKLVQVIEPFEIGGWEVPVFRWRLNVFDLMRALERFRMERTEVPAIFGAHGDDCTAFRLSATGHVEEYIVCECKCTLTHRAELIAKGHEQLRSAPMAMDTLQLLRILKDAPAAIRDRWVEPLRAMYRRGANAVPRRHLFLYVHGQRPINKATWIPRDQPHEAYAAKEPLEAVELHIDGVDALIAAVYAEQPAWR
jgi:hypothetical protein